MTRSIRAVTLVATVAAVAGFSACHRGSGASPAAAPKAAAAPKTPPEVTPAAIAMGDSLFNNGSCQRCHGKAGTGGKNGPDLTVGPFLHSAGSYEDIVKTITTGVPKAEFKDPTRPNPMPAMGGRSALTAEQVKSVAAYVYSISRNKK